MNPVKFILFSIVLCTPFFGWTAVSKTQPKSETTANTDIFAIGFCKSQYKDSALQCAAQYKLWPLAKSFIEAGVQDNENNDVLVLASQFNQKEIVKLLVENQTCPLKKEHLLEWAKSWASFNGHADLVDQFSNMLNTLYVIKYGIGFAILSVSTALLGSVAYYFLFWMHNEGLWTASEALQLLSAGAAAMVYISLHLGNKVVSGKI